MFLSLAFIFLILSVVSIIKEKRRFRNGVFLILFFIFLAIGLTFDLPHHNLAMFNLIAAVIILLGFLTIAIMIAFLFWDTYLMCKKEGRKLTSFLPAGFACLIVAFLFLGMQLIMDSPHMIWIIIAWLGFSFLFYLAILFWSFWLYSFIYSIFPKKVDCDFIIIHGAGLLRGQEVSPLLAGRINQAILLYEKGGRKAKLIASGGKGGDETISEAAAIQQYLLEKQIPAEDIILEDQSTSTYENLKYSKNIMDGLKSGYSCLFVTSNYHVFRTSIYAKRLQINGEGVGSKTAMYYWPSAFIREYIALLVRFKLGIVLWMLLWAVLITISLMPLNLPL